MRKVTATILKSKLAGLALEQGLYLSQHPECAASRVVNTCRALRFAVRLIA